MTRSIEPPGEFRADLHCHTTCSDGSFSPTKVIDLAVAAGLQGLAISDHDTIDAYPQVLIEAQERGIEMVTAVEVSAEHLGESIHILAYSFDENSPIIRQFCAEHQLRRQNRMREMLRLLAKSGLDIKESELPAASGKSIGRPHIAQVMVDKGYVKDINEAFKKYLAEGKPCYAPGKTYSVVETFDRLKPANPLIVLAHPHLIASRRALKELLLMPFDGIECYYARFTLQQNKRWLDIAAHKGWLATGGSDFHGPIKPLITLGCSYAPEETFRILQKRFTENRTVSPSPS